MGPDEAVDLEPAREIIARHIGQRGALIEVLQAIQASYGYLPHSALSEVASALDVTKSQVYGVATFYSQFSLTQRGRHVIRTCDGTACHVKGSNRLIEVVQKELGIGPGETTPDFNFSFELVFCLGSCGLSPVAVIDGRTIGRLTTKRLTQILRALKAQSIPAPVEASAGIAVATVR
jgi:NADH-quinone oxidoreductase subunit E